MDSSTAAWVPSLSTLRDLSTDNRVPLAAQIRAFLMRHTRATGGRLGPDRGIVDILIALHWVFNFPCDHIVFEPATVPACPKSSRSRAWHSPALCQGDSLSVCLSRVESDRDLPENSDAFTVLSADGTAQAFQINGEAGRCIIAAIGDGAPGGGMAYEAPNDIASHRGRLVIIVDDNGRSYAFTTQARDCRLNVLRSGGGTEGLRNRCAFVLDTAGGTGPDGPSHRNMWVTRGDGANRMPTVAPRPSPPLRRHRPRQAERDQGIRHLRQHFRPKGCRHHRGLPLRAACRAGHSRVPNPHLSRAAAPAPDTDAFKSTSIAWPPSSKRPLKDSS
ncbi:1-deoxy-D-xylulose-5-phosphate synthase N-terminal domain-containing protein [Streptomyces chartreusis]|uniref:1-deoxy-D-xylulose-5-phosphate synthase N-terminal domain-containing protein n=1 Tax=Streptomyces chartreusis TaxID=1969 RepID=UPI002E194D49|nr:1-deoxy-D-xylulose-5-phosphate synthase N-terminal domain-containing protein [Streptomyces chartreusis]